MTGIPIEQPSPDLVFELRDTSAQSGRRYAKLIGRRCELADACQATERPHIVNSVIDSHKLIIVAIFAMDVI